MIWEGYGQIAHHTLLNILLSNASLVTKPCIARLVEDDAFNLSALSDCSTGPSPPARVSLSFSRAFKCHLNFRIGPVVFEFQRVLEIDPPPPQWGEG